MSLEPLRGGMVKGRKEHECSACRRAISKGAEHMAEAYAYDGAAYTLRSHLACWHVLKFGVEYWGCADNEHDPEQLFLETVEEIIAAAVWWLQKMATPTGASR